ncbi:hypothetical protein [Pedobacter sp. Leaf176]|uniref:hypothetical protein n=1 Tax=Pedobacter sp. Leaf176 TaxID=1736286 RepID=UPI0006FBDB76|nr:hypothetical protein [Pedobacter sp. Leaf176]KQR72436.1 hypothetical protein ASF92_03905 [Pedobacter sp. Leaf176]
MQVKKLMKEVEEREEQLNAVQDKYFSQKIDDNQFKDACARYLGIIVDKLKAIEDLKSQIVRLQSTSTIAFLLLLI